MPVYVYRCYECGLEAEVLRRMDEGDDPYKCQECGAVTKRQVTASNVIVGGTPEFTKNVKRDLDVVIGKQSEERWDSINKETAKRNEVRKQTGATALGRKADGTYVPVGPKRLQNRENAYKRFEYAKRTGTKVERDE